MLHESDYFSCCSNTKSDPGIGHFFYEDSSVSDLKSARTVKDGNKSAKLNHYHKTQNIGGALLKKSNSQLQLPPYAFRSLHIKKLVLRNNGLVQIAAGAFNGPLLNSLEELEVRSNQLGSIPQTGVNEIRALRALSFSDNLITSVENNDFLSYHSRATIKRLDLTANNISIINPQGFLGLEVSSHFNKVSHWRVVAWGPWRSMIP